MTLDDTALKTKVIDKVKDAGGKVDLTEADKIVSCGRGMKGPGNYKILEELAELIGASGGASRSAVDAGWRPHSDQVGQTGKVGILMIYPIDRCDNNFYKNGEFLLEPTYDYPM